MSEVSIESVWKEMKTLTLEFKHFNKMVMKSIDSVSRASTKIVAAHSSTKGLMMGVVADLDLMTGAFGKVKNALANMFLPLDQNAKKGWKLFSAMTSLEGMWTHVLKPIKKNIKAGYEQTKAEKLKAKADKSLLSLDKVRMKQAQEKYVIDQRDVGLQKALFGEKVTGADPDDIMRAIPPTPFLGAEPPPGKAPPEISNMDKMHNTMGKTWKNMKKPVKSFEKNVAMPLKQIASGGLGLGFQATIVMGLMQAFSSIFTIFQPIIDVVGVLMERLSIGFMPIVMMVMDILTSEPVLAMIDMLAEALAQIFEMFRPLVPIIIKLIELALLPFMLILDEIMPIIQILADLFAALMIAFMPLIEILFDVLAPIITTLVKLFALLVVIGMYPLVGAIYGIGIAIAAIIDVFSWIPGVRGGNVKKWNALMLPIFGALNVATGAVIDSFQTGTDYVQRTGVYRLHKKEAVLNPMEAEDYRSGRGEQKVIINIDGGIWVQDLDEFATIMARKLQLYKG